MCPVNRPVLVLYATRQGQAERIAIRLAEHLQRAGLHAQVHDVEELPSDWQPGDHTGAVIGGSVHGDRFDRHLRSTVRRLSEAFSKIPHAVFAVGAFNTRDDTAERAWSDLERFVAETRLEPFDRACFGGALSHAQQGRFTRHLVHAPDEASGREPDVDPEQAYTDWAAVDRFGLRLVDGFAPPQMIHAERAPAAAAADLSPVRRS